jgi:putative ABC transport system ATP-binding protein
MTEPRATVVDDGSSRQPAIELVGVTKSYGVGELSVPAIRGIDLTVPVGQVVVVLGPSGSGKTTLMNLIGGIERPTSGTIRVAGQDLTTHDDEQLTAFRRRELGFVFQFFNLIPTLTAAENVELVAELVGSPAGVAQAALDQVGLAARSDHFPSALSGGEQQRVAIARALAKAPSILLCDEPTGSLDLETGRQVLSVLHGVRRRGSRTVVLVTHNSAIAAMADRVLHLGSGRLVSDQVVAHPVPAEEICW